MSKLSGARGYILRNDEGEAEELLITELDSNKHRKSFFMSDMEGCMILVEHDLTATEYKVMLVMLAHMDFENYAYISQSFLSDKLKIAQPNISRTVNKLLKRGFLFKEKMNGVNCFRVNSCVAWRGKNTKKHREMLERDSSMLSV